MEKRSFEIQVDGKVSLEVFLASIEAWDSLIKNATNVVGRENVGETQIESLQTGSTLVATETSFQSAAVADRFESIVRGTAQHALGISLSPLPKRMNTPVRKLRSLAARLPENEGFVIRTPEEDFLIREELRLSAGASIPIAGAHAAETIGVISGKLESISSRQGIKAVIYDDLFDKAVRLNLDETWHDRIQELWSRDVMASGLIRRDPPTGRPLSVRDLRSIDPIEYSGDRWSWKNAKGVLKDMAPSVKSEDLIRSAWDE